MIDVDSRFAIDIVRRPVLEWETLDGNKREETD